MKIHEYQGKEIFRKFGMPTPRGIPAFSVEEAVEAAKQLGGSVWVVKAQIHAGGRGKGGGVKVAKSLDEVRKLSSSILGMQLKTHQTGPEGQKVRRLYIEDGADINVGRLERTMQWFSDNWPDASWPAEVDRPRRVSATADARR